MYHHKVIGVMEDTSTVLRSAGQGLLHGRRRSRLETLMSCDHDVSVV